ALTATKVFPQPAPGPTSTHRLLARRSCAMGSHQEKTPTCFQIGVSCLKLDDDLLSHGEAPHYHRRCIVSLLSSEWDQVVPMLYGRQAIRLLCGVESTRRKGGKVIADWLVISVLFLTVVSHGRPRPGLLGCYMVKPHGQLVLVSSTPHSAYTPSLSTS